MLQKLRKIQRNFCEIFAPWADEEGEGVEDVRVEVLLLHQLVQDVGHRRWRNPLPVISAIIRAELFHFNVHFVQ